MDKPMSNQESSCSCLRWEPSSCSRSARGTAAAQKPTWMLRNSYLQRKTHQQPWENLMISDDWWWILKVTVMMVVTVIMAIEGYSSDDGWLVTICYNIVMIDGYWLRKWNSSLQSSGGPLFEQSALRWDRLFENTLWECTCEPTIIAHYSHGDPLVTVVVHYEPLPTIISTTSQCNYSM